MWLCMLVACCLCLLKNMLNNSFYVSCFFQSGKKTVKAVLWVSADGLRVVDDKTKVSKHICVCVCHPFLLVSSSPLFSLSTYLITHRATGTRGGKFVSYSHVRLHTTQVFYRSSSFASAYGDRVCRSNKDRNTSSSPPMLLSSLYHTSVSASLFYVFTFS